MIDHHQAPQASEILPISPDHLWAIAGPSITVAVEKELVPLATQARLAGRASSVDELPDYSRKSHDEAIARLLPCEERFVKDVSGAVLAAMELRPDASEYLVLFDLDETLARRSLSGSGAHVIRPSAVPVIAVLQGLDSRIKFGLLTSRGQKYLDEELSNPNELASLTPYLDPSKVFSSRQVSVYEMTSKYLPDEENFGFAKGVLQKVKICEELLGESEGRSIILVDDFEEFKNVRPDERFRTLHLGADSGFWIHF